MIETASQSFLQREAVRQFVKFIIIGCSSFILDFGISYVLIYTFNWAWPIAKTLSFAVAVTNGFIWNRLWTFRGQGSGAHHELYMKFVGVNIVGFLLQLGIMKSVLYVFTGQLIHHGQPDRIHFIVATGCAVVIASLWNFIANRHWTFAK